MSKYLISLQAYDRIHITVVNDHNLADFSVNSYPVFFINF